MTFLDENGDDEAETCGEDDDHLQVFVGFYLRNSMEFCHSFEDVPDPCEHSFGGLGAVAYIGEVPKLALSYMGCQSRGRFIFRLSK